MPKIEAGTIELESEAMGERPTENATRSSVNQPAIVTETEMAEAPIEEAVRLTNASGEAIDDPEHPHPWPANGPAEVSPAVADNGTAMASDVAEASDAVLAPLLPGTLLADRYLIAELLSSEADGNLYTALDLARCAVCGFEGNASVDDYCVDCGAALDSPPTCQIREQPERVEPEAVARFNADGRVYTVLAWEPADEAKATEPAPPRPIRLHWGARTDPGQVRALNEDALDVHVHTSQSGPTLGLFSVADGVGGQAAGEVASQLASHVIWEHIRETVWLPQLQGEPVLPETLETRCDEAIQAANQAVYRQQVEQGNDMATTVTLALIRDTVAVIANVGDSRTYRWNAGGLQQLTTDHSLVQSLIEAGQLEPEGIYTYPQRNVIYRAVGIRSRIEVDTFVHELAPGDRLILCSDGLWEMARDEGIEEILLREPDPQAACDVLVERANLAGGVDNISVIIVQLS